MTKPIGFTTHNGSSFGFDSSKGSKIVSADLRQFWYHPSNRNEVGKAIESGALLATRDQLRESSIFPLDGSLGPILGFWIDSSILTEFVPRSILNDYRS